VADRGDGEVPGEGEGPEQNEGLMVVERDAAGDVVVRELAPLHADTLVHVPIWLRSDDPRVRARLLPEAFADEERERQWRRYATPDLEHLFASRAEIVERDLAGLTQDRAMRFSLTIPAAHGSAWLSALNGARLALFALHDLRQVDMERLPNELGDFDRELALVRIHIMAFLQEMLIEAGV
jgi:hypothetical protein